MAGKAKLLTALTQVNPGVIRRIDEVKHLQAPGTYPPPR